VVTVEQVVQQVPTVVLAEEVAQEQLVVQVAQEIHQVQHLRRVTMEELALIMLGLAVVAGLAVLDKLEVQTLLAAQMVDLVNLHRFQEVQ
jgi:hypothetical protein